MNVRYFAVVVLSICTIICLRTQVLAHLMRHLTLRILPILETRCVFNSL